jgi:undecaprenyl-diphosphatase
MTIWQALLLGLVQGIAEFLPISSSGHLILVEHLLGFQNFKQYILFDLICHLGTLGAVLAVFFTDIKNTVKDKAKFAQVFVALVPLLPLFPLIKIIQSTFDRPEILGFCFCASALILFLGERLRWKMRGPAWQDALIVGCSQAAAIFPGLSRSAATISCARILGWNPKEAVRFSFILSIPTIFAGIALESAKLLSSRTLSPDIALSAYVSGLLSAFIVGFFSLKLLIRIIGSAKFQVFAWYCLCIGLATLYFFY